MDIQLLVRVDNKPEKKVTVNKDVIIGRSKTCQFRVLSNDVSREHCKLIVSDEIVAIRDLGSSNGTNVNGKTIPTGIDVLLHPGSTVDVGPLKFVVQFESKHKIAPPPTDAPAAPAAGEKATKPKAPPAASAAKPAVTKPTADKAVTSAAAKSKTAAKPTSAAASSKAGGATKSAAAAAAPTKKKVAKKPTAPAAEEAEFPFAAGASESDDGPAWPDFLLGGDQSSEGPTVTHAPAAEAAAPVETEEFAFSAPPEADDADEPVFDFSGDDEPSFEPGGFAEPEEAEVVAVEEAASEPVSEVVAEVVEAVAVEPVVADTAVVSNTPADDEPVFGDFAGGDDDSEFAFDPDAAAASAPPTPTPAATPAKPAATTTAAQPGKLKSLFGLFGKGKPEKPASAPAQPAAATPVAKAAAPAATSAPAPAGGDDDLTSFLSGDAPASGGDDDDTPDWMKQLS